MKEETKQIKEISEGKEKGPKMTLMIKEDWAKSIHRESGMTLEEEKRYRAGAVLFIKNYGKSMVYKKKETITYKAIFIFHKYSVQKSFKKFDRYMYGAVSVLLAGKIEDELRKFEEAVLRYKYHIYLMQQTEGAGPLKDFKEKEFENGIVDFQKSVDSKSIQETKNIFFNTEMDLLKMMGYELNITLPYTFLDEFQQNFPLPGWGEDDKKKFYRYSRNIINDSFGTLVCLYYEPYLIALAGLASASLVYKMLPDKWYTFFSSLTSLDEINEIVKCVTDIYRSS